MHGLKTSNVSSRVVVSRRDEPSGISAFVRTHRTDDRPTGVGSGRFRLGRTKGTGSQFCPSSGGSRIFSGGDFGNPTRTEGV